ncbi:hypothetical protein IF1G_01739 [Cordyceps javanica]|uniref:Uncharacterized protein n=1 Tax=Cordyceps javanica TaxID=43265 RepID=A0A545VCR8_9HYPO|nr:hypothetical protein IF1G_01739 [Cordyceps javanica]
MRYLPRSIILASTLRRTSKEECPRAIRMDQVDEGSAAHMTFRRGEAYRQTLGCPMSLHNVEFPTVHMSMVLFFRIAHGGYRLGLPSPATRRHRPGFRFDMSMSNRPSSGDQQISCCCFTYLLVLTKSL